MLTPTDLRDRVPAVLRSNCGRTIDLDVGRWVDDVDEEEERLLDEAVGPVLDVGCGPGRMVAALQRRGVAGLGIDIHLTAVEAARARGVSVVRADVFGPIPDEGRWTTALLLDGNIGIGGDPIALLGRLREILAARGRILAELEAPGTIGARLVVRAEVADQLRSDWFPWAIVGLDDLPSLGMAAGFTVARTWRGGARWFAHLDAV